MLPSILRVCKIPNHWKLLCFRGRGRGEGVGVPRTSPVPRRRFACGEPGRRRSAGRSTRPDAANLRHPRHAGTGSHAESPGVAAALAGRPGRTLNKRRHPRHVGTGSHPESPGVAAALAGRPGRTLQNQRHPRHVVPMPGRCPGGLHTVPSVSRDPPPRGGLALPPPSRLPSVCQRPVLRGGVVHRTYGVTAGIERDPASVHAEPRVAR